MNSAAFALGRLLKLADLLHRNYCIYERNDGDKKKPLPRALMGNAVFSLARQRPLEAVNRLQEKIRIYIVWAQSDPESHSLWILRALGRAASYFEDHDLPATFDEAEQAMLLFGYLTNLPGEYLPKKTKDDQTSGEDADAQTEEKTIEEADA